MKITCYGHSCFKIETGGSKILIDPFITGNPTHDIPVDQVSEGVTHVVLTHGHDDHVGDTVEICKQTGAKLVAVFELAMYLNGKGVETVDPTNTGGTVAQDDFDVTFVNALHSSGSIVDGQVVYLGNPCGVMIKPSQGKSVYHMGDTDLFPGMELINELHKPEIGIVPIGDRFTMGAWTASIACKKFFNFQTIIPCHYGTFPIIDQTADKFVAEMAGHNVKVLNTGEHIDV